MNYQLLVIVTFSIFLLPLFLIVGRFLLWLLVYLWIGAIYGLEQADEWSQKWRKTIIDGISQKK